MAIALSNACQMLLFLKIVFCALNMKLFWQKSHRPSNVGKNWKYDDEKKFSEGKTFTSFKTAFLTEWEGAKYAGYIRPSCYVCLQENVAKQTSPRSVKGKLSIESS